VEAEAVEKAKSTGQRGDRGDGRQFCAVRLHDQDETNHHLWKPVFIGEIRPDGQFNVVWKTKGPVRAEPWSPFIAGNEKKPSSPV
jgi:urea transport system substrate-binding protein